MPLKTLDYLGASRLISSYHLACIFEIKVFREHGCIHEITKEHCELTALGLRFRRWGGSEGFRRRRIGETVDFTGDAGEGSIQLCRGEAIKGATDVVSGLKPAQPGSLVEAGAD